MVVAKTSFLLLVSRFPDLLVRRNQLILELFLFVSIGRLGLGVSAVFFLGYIRGNKTQGEYVIMLFLRDRDP